MAQDRHLAHWQQDVLIETLLVQDAPHFALRALRAPGPPIAPLLEIRTLLANNLVAEAFQLQRSKADDSLLREFFKTCHTQHKWHYVLDLSLNSAEEESLGTFLRTSDSTLTSNLHFVYLLQRSKYIEAISYVDDLHHNRRRRKADLDTPNTIVAAYKLTMTPATRTMSDVYYSLRDNIDTKLNQKAINPNPLSTKLLQRKLDLVGGIYHRTVLSAEQTTPAYWFGQPNKRCNLTPNNVPFLRNPQYDVQELAHKQHLHHNTGLSYANVYPGSNKRHLNESVLDAQDRRDQEKDEGPRKRRKIDPNEDPVLVTKSTRIVETTLSTPVVNPNERTPPKSALHYTAVTPHSILKIPGSPARSIRMRSLSPISADTDDRLIRFNLPDNQEDDFRAVTPVATSTIRLSPRAALDFNADLDISTANDNESPPVEKEEAEEIITPPDKNQLNYSTQESPLQRRLTVIDGPKARKRIHDGCGEGDVSVVVQSSTPIRRSLRSRSKTPDVEIATKNSSASLHAPNISANKHVQQAVQRKPLSRMVLEANAKKIIESTDALLLASKTQKSTTNVPDISFSNTTIDSIDTTVFGRFMSDSSDLSESFMERWKAERQLGNSSYCSSFNDGASLFERESFLSDSDASFLGDESCKQNQQPQVIGSNTLPHSTAQENVDEIVIIDDTNVADTDEGMEIVADDSSDEDNGSISLNVSANSESESDDSLASGDSESESMPQEKEAELVMESSSDDGDKSMTNEDDDDDDNDSNEDESDDSLSSLEYNVSRPAAIPQPTSDVINISSSSDDNVRSDHKEDTSSDTSEQSNEYDEELAIVEDEVDSADREYSPHHKVVEEELASEVVDEDPVYSNLEQVPIDLPSSNIECVNQFNTSDCSWQGLQTAEGSLVENLDEAQILETTDIPAALVEHTSSGLYELNHAIMRETDEQITEVAEETVSTTVDVNDAVNILDQGYLMEDTDAVGASSTKEISEQQIIDDKSDEVKTNQETVEEMYDEAMFMSPLLIEASQPSDLTPVQQINTATTADETTSTISNRTSPEKPTTPIKAIAPSIESLTTTPITTRLTRVTRARSISLEEHPEASSLPVTVITPRRSTRAKSITHSDVVVTPSTPTTTRRTRGASEPKQASKTPIAAMRRIVESNAHHSTPDVERTPKRRSVRRTSQSSVLTEEDNDVTPARRSKRSSPNSITPTRLKGRSRFAHTSPNDDNDDTASITSRASKFSVNSSVTTRSQAAAAAHHPMDDDDDDVSVRSAKSTRSTVSTATKRAAAVAAAARAQTLPAIDEIKETDDAHNESGSTDNAATYSNSRRYMESRNNYLFFLNFSLI